jgi:hypothetical protein
MGHIRQFISHMGIHYDRANIDYINYSIIVLMEFAGWQYYSTSISEHFEIFNFTAPQRTVVEHPSI